MNQEYPYSIKNWKDSSQYLKPNVSWGYREATKYDLNYWKWEFLRRNANYQKLYASYKKYCDDRSLSIDGNLSDFGLFYYLDPTEDQAFMHMPSLCSIHHMMDFNKYTEEINYDESLTDEKILHSILNDNESVQRKGGVFVTLDLNLPLDIQFAKLKKLIESQYKSKINKSISHIRPREWKIYLRLLDAYADKISVQEISEVIYPNETNTYDSGSPTSKKVLAGYKKAIELTNIFAVGGESFKRSDILNY